MKKRQLIELKSDDEQKTSLCLPISSSSFAGQITSTFLCLSVGDYKTLFLLRTHFVFLRTAKLKTNETKKETFNLG